MNHHDRAYKQLFQYKMLLQLLFTPEMLGAEWVGLLDFSQAELLPNEHLSRKLDLRQNDQIWRIQRTDSDEPLYVLLLLEFQSSVEPKMALRVSTYVTLLYEQLLIRKDIRLQDGLPVVLPVVLYTGLPRWYAKQELSDLIQAAPTRLEAYQPQQRYLLIDQGLWAKNKALPQNNLTALLFLLEHSEDVAEAQQLLQQLDKQSAQFRELRRAILSWLRHVYLPRVAPDVSLFDNYSFDEVHDMIELDPRRWGYKERIEGREEGLLEGKEAGIVIGREEGHEEGMQKGLEEGLKRAQLAILLRQLESKFGPLSADLKERLQSASNEQREAWALQLLQANSLQELFH